jgi:hypothetical protein
MLTPESVDMNASEAHELYKESLKSSKEVPLIPLPGPTQILPTEFAANDLPPGPFQRLQQLFESQNPEPPLEAFQDPISTFSLYLKVSKEFAKGAIGLFNLPARDQVVKYHRSLIIALRHLFVAFAGMVLLTIKLNYGPCYYEK